LHTTSTSAIIRPYIDTIHAQFFTKEYTYEEKDKKPIVYIYMVARSVDSECGYRLYHPFLRFPADSAIHGKAEPSDRDDHQDFRGH
jgi:hypothetical protein